MARFSRFVGAHARSVRTLCEPNKTLQKLMREAHRSFRATRQKRQKIDPRVRSKPLGAPLALERLTGKILERLRGGPGTLLDGSWPLLARLGRPKIGFGAAFGRPKAVPSASGRVPETALGAQNGPRSIFLRFWLNLGWMVVDFRKIFRRFSFEPRATKAQEQNLKKGSRDPQRTSWLLCCAVAFYCSYVFPNDVRTMHVQPCCVAYPQAHLV